MKSALAYLIVLTLAASAFGQSKQKISMNLDKVGNVKVTVSMSMEASQWQMWIYNYGNNPASLKRDTERSMPAYVLKNFNLSKDDMNRSFELTFDALGMCKVDKRGVWIFETGVRGADITDLGDRKYIYVDSPSEFGGQIQQIFTISFPEEASEIRLDSNAYGKTVFTFDMQTPSRSGIAKFAGGSLLLLGLAWSGIELSRTRKPTTSRNEANN